MIREPGTQLGGHGVGSFRYEIERRTEAQCHFEFRELPAPGQTIGSLHIVGEHDREFFAVRPARPVIGGATGRLVDRPHRPVFPSFPSGDNPAQSHPHPPGQIGLQQIIIEVAFQHGALEGVTLAKLTTN